jgi:N utilization substance protein B
MAALQSLFAADIKGVRGDDSLEWLGVENSLQAATVSSAQALARGVTNARAELDGVIGKYAPAWPVNQLPPIDRNVLRIALFELLHTPTVPRKTAINEAVELAKLWQRQFRPVHQRRAGLSHGGARSR